MTNTHFTVCPTSDQKGSKSGSGGREKRRRKKIVKPCAAQPHGTEERWAPAFFTCLVTETSMNKITGAQTPRLIRCSKRSSEQVACTLPSRADRVKWAGQMGISLKVKNSR